MSLFDKIKANFPSTFGKIVITELPSIVLVQGELGGVTQEELSSLLDEHIKGNYGEKLYSVDIKFNELIAVEETVESTFEQNGILDEVDIIYYGMLPVNLIKQNTKFRHPHITIPTNLKKIDNCVKVLNFISPIVLDKDLVVIDGNKRVELAIDNDIKEVLVCVINDNDKKADFLRLALNRSAEFQRWNYPAVDDYCDTTPQAQPILEPLGFFGRFVLPESFFAKSVLNYKIDPFNKQAQMYKQEYGLAQWAKMRREQLALESAEKRKKTKKKTGDVVSLFDLQPQESDFLPTYDLEKEKEELFTKFREQADKITTEQDAIRKAYLESVGQPWQKKSTSPLLMGEKRRERILKQFKKLKWVTDEMYNYAVANIEQFEDDLAARDWQAVKAAFEAMQRGLKNDE